MATVNTQALLTPAQYVANMDEGHAICRGRHRHNWPSDVVRRDQPLPGGISTQRQRDGSYQVTEYCIDCGTECTWTTLPRGKLDRDVIRRYKYPERWVHIPREAEVTPRDIKLAHLESVAGTLFGIATRAQRQSPSS